MHQYKYIPHDSNDLNSNTQTTNLNTTSSQLSFTIKRKRSLTSLNHNKTLSLQKINKTPSPKHQNNYPSLSSSTTQKDKSCYLKSNLIQQKFNQLSLKPTLKNPLKLRISKLSNQQENHLLKQHFSNFSKQMKKQFQDQNNILKKSLQKIQNLVADNLILPGIYHNASIIKNHSDNETKQQNTNQKMRNVPSTLNKKLMLKKDIVSCSKSKQIIQIDKQPTKYKNKKIATEANGSILNKKSDNQYFQQNNQKLNQVIKENQQLKNHITKLIETNNNLNAQIQQIKAQNSKIVDELKQTKTINTFLVSQNYKLSHEISVLKNKLTDYEQQKESKKVAFNDYVINSEVSFKKQSTSNQLTQQQIMKSTSKSIEKIQRQEDQINQQKVLIKQIKTQNFSLHNNQFEDQQSQQSFINLKGDKENLDLRTDINNNSENNIEKLLQKIKLLEQELNQQKDINQGLSNKLAALKLKYHGVKCQEKNQDKENQSLDSAVSIKIHLQQEDPQQQLENLTKTAEFHQSQQKMTKPKISLQNIPHRSSKSSILSNKFIYFAQLFGKPQQVNHALNQTKQPELQETINQNLNKQQNTDFLETIKEQDEDEKKKTLCMKKLQIPADQIHKKRKTMTKLLKMSLQRRVTPNHNNNNTLSFYSKLKIFQLQNIKQTISLKFEAFKYTFELFQNQMILWPKKIATSRDLKSILSEYPFLLEGSSIDLLLPYFGVSEKGVISVDIFCNKMREFIGQYNELSEQEEIVLEKKIFKRWRYTSQEILQLMSKSETVSGEITKSSFCAILEEFKFQASEIHHLLSQSVAISPDLNRIKYKHYLDNFLAKN